MANEFAKREREVKDKMPAVGWWEAQKQVMCSHNARKAQKWEFPGSTDALGWEWESTRADRIARMTEERSSSIAALEQKEQPAQNGEELWKECSGRRVSGGNTETLKNNKKETMASSVFESCLCYLWTVNISKSVNVFGLRFPHLLNKRLVYMFMVHSNSDILWSFWVKRQ